MLTKDFYKKRIHLIGIGGAGLNAIAHALLDHQCKITGGEKLTNTATKALLRRGVKIFTDTDLGPVKKCDYLLVSSAVKPDHPAVVWAKNHHKKVVTRHDLWRLWSKEHKLIAIAGSHGKTTTAAILSHLFHKSGRDCGYIVGVHGDRSGHWGKEPFIIEADEYAETFLSIEPVLAVIVNIDRDHVDIYPDDESYRQAFKQFTTKVKAGGKLIMNVDDPESIKLMRGVPAKNLVTFGINRPANFRAKNISYQPAATAFDLIVDNQRVGSIKIGTIGKHNVYNALAAIAAGYHYSLDGRKIIAALKSFGKLYRRQQHLGSVKGIEIYDDYGHAPREVAMTLESLREAYPGRRLVCYFQPHTFTRINSFFTDFVRALSRPDVVGIGNVYASREKTGFVDLPKLLAQVNTRHKALVGTTEEAIDYFKKTLRPGDIFVALNAGDGTKVAKGLLQYLKKLKD